jgi:hypothetical protein
MELKLASFLEIQMVHNAIPLKSPHFLVENFTLYSRKRLVFMWKWSFTRLVGKLFTTRKCPFFST